MKTEKLKQEINSPEDLYVFDVETGVIKDCKIQYRLGASPDKFLFGVIYGYNYTKVIKNVKDFKNILLEDRFKNRYVFAHNVGYELYTLYGSIFAVGSYSNNGGTFSVSNGNCFFEDSLAIFPESIRNIAKKNGIERQLLANNKDLIKGDIPSEDIDYSIKDCKIVWDALFNYFEL
jgi:hypothetical protein